MLYPWTKLGILRSFCHCHTVAPTLWLTFKKNIFTGRNTVKLYPKDMDAPINLCRTINFLLTPKCDLDLEFWRVKIFSWLEYMLTFKFKLWPTQTFVYGFQTRANPDTTQKWWGHKTQVLIPTWQEYVLSLTILNMTVSLSQKSYFWVILL